MMLSEAANVANLVHRPRPPGSRRSSSMKIKQAQHHLDGQDENIAPMDHHHRPVEETSVEETHRNRLKMEKDLGLDLPSDLVAAVNASRVNRHRSCDTNNIIGMEMEDALRSSIGSKYKRRSMGFTPMQMYERKTPTVEQMETLYQADDCDEGYGESSIQHQPSLDSEIESEISIDPGYVGDLPRDQLEQMLMQANQVIKERERDLGIAAAIGKALLEKNMSLRDKHEGLMTRLSSMSSFSQFNTTEEEEEEGEDSESPSIVMPRYTPPTTDSAHSESEREEEDETPILTPRAEDYIEQPPSASQRTSLSEQAIPSYPSWPRLDHQQGHIHASSIPDYFVPSIPPSPVSSQQSDHANRSVYSTETQRQLEMLSEQNEALLEQLGQLQAEAEEAKRIGGKKLKKLDREIEGLRAELETATERNNELEKGQIEESKDSEGEVEGSKKAWRRRGTPSQSSEEANSSENSSHTIHLSRLSSPVREEVQISEIQAPAERTVMHKASEAALSIRSESCMSVSTLGNKIVNESERALVAQLMAKIQELEKTNATLTREGTERDGRIGKFIVEGERIRDAYEAVEQSAVVMEENQTNRGDESEVFDASHCVGSPFSSVAASPLAARFKRRRAPGNRYAIESRKTLRAAMKSELSLRARREEYRGMGNYSSDGDSSAGPSPMKERILRRPQRPRILITPSTEDLRASAAHDRDGDGHFEWEERRNSFDDSDQFQTMSTPLAHKYRNRRREQSEGEQPIKYYNDSSCENTPIRELRSLKAELGNFNDELSNDVQECSVQTVQQRLHLGGTLRLVDLQRSPSGASVHLRSRESISSLRAASEAASDIADLARSEMSDITVMESEVQEDVVMPMSIAADHKDGEMGQQLVMMPLMSASLPITTLGVDGTYMDECEEESFLRGCLKNEEQTTEWSYKSIQKASNRPQLAWADDDDFGKPITEREAREAGLLERCHSSSNTSKGLLAWVQKKTGRKVIDKGKGRKVRNSQIESREEVEERERLAELLGAKRVLALRSRVMNGQISPRLAQERGILDEINDPYLEEEINARALAYNIAKQKKGTVKQLMAPPLRRSSREKVPLMNEERQSRLQRGTHQSSLTLRQRYQPAAVKQRAKQFSLEAITWASTWAAFSIVMILAFFVTFGQGPKRVLNGQKK